MVSWPRRIEAARLQFHPQLGRELLDRHDRRLGGTIRVENPVDPSFRSKQKADWLHVMQLQCTGERVTYEKRTFSIGRLAKDLPPKALARKTTEMIICGSHSKNKTPDDSQKDKIKRKENTKHNDEEIHKHTNKHTHTHIQQNIKKIPKYIQKNKLKKKQQTKETKTPKKNMAKKKHPKKNDRFPFLFAAPPPSSLDLSRPSWLRSHRQP